MEFQNLQYRADDLARNDENKGRLAHVSAEATTTGPGSIEIEDAIQFSGAMFIEKPTFKYGAELDPDAIRDTLGLQPDDDVEFPQCSAHVTGWDVDENGVYSAAWVALTVSYPYTILITALIDITWHLSFVGTALKDVDPNG